MSSLQQLSDAIFWFAVVGAGVAAVKHVLQPLETLQDLSPVAIRPATKGNAKAALSPEALWWGCYCFSAMNIGFCTVGIWAGVTGSARAKEALLLGTGVMFEAFAGAWLSRGSITGKPNCKTQGFKVAAFGVLFLGGFALSLASH